MGSLFKAREYWSAKCGVGEECDRLCLALANLDNDPDGSHKIAVGSLAGTLRVWAPRQRGAQPEDLQLETDVGAPILGLAVGRFATAALSLAVLLPRRLVVGQLQRPAAAAEAGPAEFGGVRRGLAFQRQWDVPLPRVALSMVAGPFGRASVPNARESVAVLSMDGVVSLFAPDSPLSRTLPAFLTARSLAYLPRLDALVASTAQFTVECYRHAAFAAATGSDPGGPAATAAAITGGDAAAAAAAGGLSESLPMGSGGGDGTVGDASGGASSGGGGGGGGGKKLTAEWVANVGEEAVAVLLCRFSRSAAGAGSGAGAELVVVGEHTLITVRDTGAIRAQRRLDFLPTCACACPAAGEADGVVWDNVVVGAASGAFVVFSDTAVVWAMKAPHIPVAIAVGRIGGLDGVLVSVASSGEVQASYCGTDPALQTAQPLEAKELDYDAMDQEHRRLQLAVRTATAARGAPAASAVTLRAAVGEVMGGAGGHSVVVKVYASHAMADDLCDAKLLVQAPSPFVASPSCTAAPPIPPVSRGAPSALCVTISTPAPGTPGYELLPTSLSASLFLTYAVAGEPAVARASVVLPLVMAGSAVPAIKTSSYKIVLEANRPPPPLPSLFDDLDVDAAAAAAAAAGGGGTAPAHVLSVRWHAGGGVHDATVVVSKAAWRYRVQASSFESLWLLAAELSRRLRLRFASDAPPPSVVAVPSSPPPPGTAAAAAAAADAAAAIPDAAEPGADPAAAAPAPGGTTAPFALTVSDNLPFPEYFAAVDAHHAARAALARANAELDAAARQFRCVQKALLARFRDRSPAPLNGLDKLVDATHRRFDACADSAVTADRDLKKASNALACSTALILFLVRLRYHLRSDDADLLRHYLTPHVADCQAQGWEECVEAAMTHLLRTSLAKSAKEAATAPVPLTAPADPAKLRKHILLVCDRLAKGGSLSSNPAVGVARPTTGPPAQLVSRAAEATAAAATAAAAAPSSPVTESAPR